MGLEILSNGTFRPSNSFLLRVIATVQQYPDLLKRLMTKANELLQ
jgi:hypothetical protein